MSDFTKARALLYEFKRESYLYGVGALARVGTAAVKLGKRAALVRDTFPGSDKFVAIIRESLAEAGCILAGEVDGAGPNAPREDLFRITGALKALNPDVIISFGGGSTIDATKAAEVLRTLGGRSMTTSVRLWSRRGWQPVVRPSHPISLSSSQMIHYSAINVSC